MTLLSFTSFIHMLQSPNIFLPLLMLNSCHIDQLGRKIILKILLSLISSSITFLPFCRYQFLTYIIVPSGWRTIFNTSFRTGLLVESPMNYFCFCLSKKVFICPSILKDHFPGFRVVVSRITLHISVYSFLTCMISDSNFYPCLSIGKAFSLCPLTSFIIFSLLLVFFFVVWT